MPSRRYSSTLSIVRTIDVFNPISPSMMPQHEQPNYLKLWLKVSWTNNE